MSTILIKHGFVITMDPERRMISNGAVAIQDDRIVEVGKVEDIGPRFRAEKEVDATGKLVLPGLIDSHNHSVQYLSKGIGDDVHILKWLYERVYPYEAHLTPSDVYVGALGNYTEMMKSGTTCCADPGGYYMDEVAEAMKLIGIRGILSRSTRDLIDSRYPIPERFVETTEEAVGRGEDLVKKWHGAENDRIRVWFSLRVIENCSDTLCRAISEIADKYDVGIHAHLAASQNTNERSIQLFGLRCVERYRRLGVLGPNFLAVHAGAVNREEVGVLQELDVKVAHCPSASMHGAYGVIKNGMFPEMVADGITVSLGTDSATAGRFLDMVRVMYLAACAHKDATLDPEVMGAYKALEMATIDGARALLWDDQIGSLDPGKKADVIIVNMDGPEWHPLRDPVRNFVYSADGHSVETSIIDGKVVMENRVLVTVNERQVVAEVARAGRAIIDRAGIQIPSPWKLV